MAKMNVLIVLGIVSSLVKMTSSGDVANAFVEAVCSVATKLAQAYTFLYYIDSLISLTVTSVIAQYFIVARQIMHFGLGSAVSVPMEPRTAASN